MIHLVLSFARLPPLPHPCARYVRWAAVCRSVSRPPTENCVVIDPYTQALAFFFRKSANWYPVWAVFFFRLTVEVGRDLGVTWGDSEISISSEHRRHRRPFMRNVT